MGIRGSLTLLGVIHGATLMTFCSGTQLGPLARCPHSVLRCDNIIFAFFKSTPLIAPCSCCLLNLDTKLVESSGAAVN